MPAKHVSEDLKARIPILRYEHGYSVKNICLLLDVKKSMVYQILTYHRTYGVTSNPHRRASHRQRILSPVDVEFIRSLLSQQHTLYLDEIQTELRLRRNVYVSIPTIVRTLRRIHFSSKSVSVKALERNETARAVFMNRIGQLVTDMDMVMFADESAKDDRNVSRMKGYSLVGTRCVQRRCFVRGKRYSILPILTLDGIIAYDIIEGSVTSDRFVRFLKDMVVCPSRLSADLY
jgi:transposase